MAPTTRPEAGPRLEVHPSGSVLVHTDGTAEPFPEGPPSAGAKARLAAIRRRLGDGFLADVITTCRTPGHPFEPVDDDDHALLDRLVKAVTSGEGRAVVGLTVLLLSVKAVSPGQSVRLHKAGGGRHRFSWQEGVPLRSLDEAYNTPVLRDEGLLTLNAFGVMMTRSLAENYPYCKLYKGGSADWLEVVDRIESGRLEPLPALQHLVAILINRSERFELSAEQALRAVTRARPQLRTPADAVAFLAGFVAAAPHPARLLEVAMHSLFQVLTVAGGVGGRLKPLSQMRSANKKHGNVGDIEIVSRADELSVLEAWDAKHGRLDLSKGLAELGDKLAAHPETRTAGFVTDRTPAITPEVEERVRRLERRYDVRVEIVGFDEWAARQFGRAAVAPTAGADWVTAFAECLCQKRRHLAPIDEPCDAWVDALAAYAAGWSPHPGETTPTPRRRATAATRPAPTSLFPV